MVQMDDWLDKPWEQVKAEMAEERKKKKEQILSERNVDEPTLIKSIRGKYKNLHEDIISENWVEILDVEDEQEKCKSCQGLEQCDHPSKGYYRCVNDSKYLHCFDVTHYPCRFERQRQKQVYISRLLKASGVPRIYEKISFDEYKETDENRKAIEAAHWIVNDDKDSSVYFYGSKGTGKTMLSCVITNEIARRGQVVLFSSVPDLMADIRASFKSDNTEEVINSVKNAPILVLDDLGAERATEWVGEQIFAIINARYADKRKTIITSNFAPDELAAHFADKTQGERIVSRIYGMCARVQIKGKDWRMSA